MLKRLHERHEIHYVAFQQNGETEGLERAVEYSTQAYAIPHAVPARGTIPFFAQLAANLFSGLPLSVSRYVSPAMREVITSLRSKHNFDSVVCDFLFPAPNFSIFDDVVLFEHNVESMIWQRHVESSGDPLRKAYFGMQYQRMLACEAKACGEAAHVIAVSAIDARKIERMFALSKVSDIKTGVDVDYFAPTPTNHPKVADLVFVGSMDWMPNIDGVRFFISEVLPLIYAKIPDVKLVIVGRTPPAEIQKMAGPNVYVTGTVADIRPYLWGSAVSIVPLRIGSGTRLKIYESMAAKTAVVSTTIGAEGLIYDNGTNIAIADSAEDFARACINLIENVTRRGSMAQSAFQMVAERFSWAQIANEFEDVLKKYPARKH